MLLGRAILQRVTSHMSGTKREMLAVCVPTKLAHYCQDCCHAAIHHVIKAYIGLLAFCSTVFDVSAYLQDQNMPHRPYHPMTQGKIERWHRSLKSTIAFEHYCLPGDRKAVIGRFVHYYNTRRYH
jgi:hypothetical protein